MTSYMAEHRVVRATELISVARDFIAPDMMPVATTALEQDKGIAGWTDRDVRVSDDSKSQHLPAGHAERLLDEIKCGTVIVRTKPKSNAIKIRSRYL